MSLSRTKLFFIISFKKPQNGHILKPKYNFFFWSSDNTPFLTVHTHSSKQILCLEIQVTIYISYIVFLFFFYSDRTGKLHLRKPNASRLFRKIYFLKMCVRVCVSLSRSIFFNSTEYFFPPRLILHVCYLLYRV